MKVENRLDSLREQVRLAAETALLKLDNMSHAEYEEDYIPMTLIHDNVKVIEAKLIPFSYSFDPKKEQVIVILRGKWVLVHDRSSKNLYPTDVIKIPMGNEDEIELKTEEPDAKFVYVQFK